MTRLVLLVLLVGTGCGFHEHEGRVRMPFADGRCEIVVADSLGPEAPTRGGPNALDHAGNGVVCEVWRF